MDCRQTLRENETFLKILQASHQEKQKLNLIIDENGMSRREGFIKLINTNTALPFIELEDGTKIEMRSIIAVNGIFLPEYGEC